MTKTRVAILFGGRSAEHEVSIQSAKNVYKSLDKEKYEVILIGIDKKGKWVLNQPAQLLLTSSNPELVKLNNEEVSLIQKNQSTQLVSVSSNQSLGGIDVVFPVLHGPYGEDGTIQGMLKLLNIPFVGPSVLGSALGMDKDVMKRLLREAKIPVVKFLVFRRTELKKIDFDKIVSQLGLPFFVKPANLGSSVGISKVKNKEEFKKALELAFEFDRKILIEEFIKGREIECSVLGNETPTASIPGEIIPTHEFYSYEAKYVDENGAKLRAPAELPKNIAKNIQDLAIKTFKTLCCEGMSRVDFFLTKKGEIFVNEINTIPGFTQISMYPKLWEVSGISYKELVDRLIQLALERFKRENNLKTSF